MRPFALALCFLFVCSVSRLWAKPLSSPTSRQGQPRLVAGSERLWMSWQQTSLSGQTTLLISSWKDSWSEPRTIVEGVFFVNWADFPALSVSPSEFLVSWLAPYPDSSSSYAYGIRVASSTNGEEWGRPLQPHSDDSPVEHGFVSFFRDKERGPGLVWLDGRDTLTRKTMTLRARFLESDEEFLLDDRVCSCCNTTAVSTPSGVLIAYRDRSEKEIRDISVVKFRQGQWSEPVSVHNDGWRIAGCPVNGPALASREKRVALAWFTLIGGKTRVNLALSENEGASFTTPLRLDAGRPVGRVDLTYAEDGSLYVCWLENESLGFRRLSASGELGPWTKVAAVSMGRGTGYPQIEFFQGSLFFAWTDGEQIRMEQIELPVETGDGKDN